MAGSAPKMLRTGSQVLVVTKEKNGQHSEQRDHDQAGESRRDGSENAVTYIGRARQVVRLPPCRVRSFDWRLRQMRKANGLSTDLSRNRDRQLWSSKHHSPHLFAALCHWLLLPPMPERVAVCVHGPESSFCFHCTARHVSKLLRARYGFVARSNRSSLGLTRRISNTAANTP
jgi:hypothetical protein